MLHLRNNLLRNCRWAMLEYARVDKTKDRLLRGVRLSGHGSPGIDEHFCSRQIRGRLSDVHILDAA